MAEDVKVAIVGTKLEEDVSWTVPLVQYFLYEIFAIIQSKADWPFVRFGARIALNVKLHLIIVPQYCCGEPTTAAPIMGHHGDADSSG